MRNLDLGDLITNLSKEGFIAASSPIDYYIEYYQFNKERSLETELEKDKTLEEKKREFIKELDRAKNSLENDVLTDEGILKLLSELEISFWDYRLRLGEN